MHRTAAMWLADLQFVFTRNQTLYQIKWPVSVYFHYISILALNVLMTTLLCCRADYLSALSCDHIPNPFNKCYVVFKDASGGPLAWAQHCIMTALAVAHAIVERSEWKLGLSHQHWGWLQLVACGAVWSSSLDDPKVRTSKPCCLHPQTA